LLTSHKQDELLQCRTSSILLVSGDGDMRHQLGRLMASKIRAIKRRLITSVCSSSDSVLCAAWWSIRFVRRRDAGFRPIVSTLFMYMSLLKWQNQANRTIV